MMNRVRQYLKLDKGEKKLYKTVYILTAYYRFRILYTPFSKLAEKMGKLNSDNLKALEYEQVDTAKLIKRAVQRISKHTIWESKCLVQALVGQKLMTRAGINHTLYLGLAKRDKETIAHAWLSCGEEVIIGGYDISQYSVIAKFGSDTFERNI